MPENQNKSTSLVRPSEKYGNIFNDPLAELSLDEVQQLKFKFFNKLKLIKEEIMDLKKKN